MKKILIPLLVCLCQMAFAQPTSTEWANFKKEYAALKAKVDAYETRISKMEWPLKLDTTQFQITYTPTSDMIKLKDSYVKSLQTPFPPIPPAPDLTQIKADIEELKKRKIPNKATIINPNIILE